MVGGQCYGVDFGYAVQLGRVQDVMVFVLRRSE